MKNSRKEWSLLRIGGWLSVVFGLQVGALVCWLSGKKEGIWLLTAAILVFVALSLELLLFFLRYLPERLDRLKGRLEGEEIHNWEKQELFYPLKLLDELSVELEKENYNPYKIRFFQMQAEFNALQKQISPHFLYNTLETIRSKALDCGSQDIMELVEAFAMLFRFRIGRTGEMATFKEEMDYVGNYMTINHYRFGSLYRLTVEYEEEEIRDCIMPVLTLPPVVENAIFQGLEPKGEGGEVKLKVTATQKRIIITVSDNGVGMESDKLSQLQKTLYHPRSAMSSGKLFKQEMGTLENLNQRIQYYFGQGFGIHVTSAYGIGTTVDIMLPRI